ncbi:hypothetical protein ACPYO6_12090 [Georgenia sp. Z1344]|uniref:hypothetical protein n=1 Tax=Georgenia sp. Z1344 TaxID=3416706 RepID=UPI003CFAE029
MSTATTTVVCPEAIRRHVATVVPRTSRPTPRPSVGARVAAAARRTLSAIVRDEVGDRISADRTHRGAQAASTSYVLARADAR